MSRMTVSSSPKRIVEQRWMAKWIDGPGLQWSGDFVYDRWPHVAAWTLWRRKRRIIRRANRRFWSFSFGRKVPGNY